MIYEEMAPSAAFEPFVERYWRFVGESSEPAEFELIIVPDGTLSMGVVFVSNRWSFSLSGPQSTARRLMIVNGGEYRGVRFRAGAAGAFLGVDMQSLVGVRVPLIDVAPSLETTLRHTLAPDASDGLSGLARAFEAAAVGWTARRPDPVVSALVQRLVDDDGFTPLQDLLDSHDIGERQARRRFLAETGLTPKVFSRLRRVRRACIDLMHRDRGQVADVSVVHGFADQAHFTRELKAVFDMSPRALQTYLRQIKHTNLYETLR